MQFLKFIQQIDKFKLECDRPSWRSRKNIYKNDDPAENIKPNIFYKNYIGGLVRLIFDFYYRYPEFWLNYATAEYKQKDNFLDALASEQEDIWLKNRIEFENSRKDYIDALFYALSDDIEYITANIQEIEKKLPKESQSLRLIINDYHIINLNNKINRVESVKIRDFISSELVDNDICHNHLGFQATVILALMLGPNVNSNAIIDGLKTIKNNYVDYNSDNKGAKKKELYENINKLKMLIEQVNETKKRSQPIPINEEYLKFMVHVYIFVESKGFDFMKYLIEMHSLNFDHAILDID